MKSEIQQKIIVGSIYVWAGKGPHHIAHKIEKLGRGTVEYSSIDVKTWTEVSGMTGTTSPRYVHERWRPLLNIEIEFFKDLAANPLKVGKVYRWANVMKPRFLFLINKIENRSVEYIHLHPRSLEPIEGTIETMGYLVAHQDWIQVSDIEIEKIKASDEDVVFDLPAQDHIHSMSEMSLPVNDIVDPNVNYSEEDDLKKIQEILHRRGAKFIIDALGDDIFQVMTR